MLMKCRIESMCGFKQTWMVSCNYANTTCFSFAGVNVIHIQGQSHLNQFRARFGWEMSVCMYLSYSPIQYGVLAFRICCLPQKELHPRLRPGLVNTGPSSIYFTWKFIFFSESPSISDSEVEVQDLVNISCGGLTAIWRYLLVKVNFIVSPSVNIIRVFYWTEFL